MSLKPTRNSTFGVLLILAAVGLLAYGLTGKPNPFAHQRVVYAQFSDVSTVIRFDRDVQIDGVDVGTIGAIRRQGDHALVQLLLDPSVGPIYANATASIRPHTIFDGNSYVELDPGTPASPPLGSRPIPLSQTHSYVSLDLFLRLFNRRFQTAFPQLLASTSAALTPDATAGLRTASLESPAMFRALVPALRALQGPTRIELGGVIAGSARTLTAVAASEAKVGPLLSSAVRSVAGIRAGDTPLDQTLAGLPAALEAAGTDSRTVETTVDDLRSLAGPLTPGLEQTPATMRALSTYLVDATPQFAIASPFVSELRSSLAAGLAAGPSGRMILKGLLPAFTSLHTSVAPALLKPSTIGPPVYVELAAMVSGAAGSMGNTQSPAQAVPANEGEGHLWSFSAVSPAGVGCQSLPSELAPLFTQYGLCSP